MYMSDDFRIEHMQGGGYMVIAPNGHSYAVESFHEARRILEANNMGYSNKMKYAVKDDYPPTKEAESYPDESVTVDDNGDVYTPKQSGWGPARDDKADRIKRLEEIVAYQAQELKAKRNVPKIQEEIDRIEAQIAKSNDEENKAKMTTYVAGLHKALKLIQL